MAEIIIGIATRKKWVGSASDNIYINNDQPMSGLTDIISRSDNIYINNDQPQSGLTDILTRSESMTFVNT